MPVDLGMRNGVTHEHPRWRKSRHVGARLYGVGSLAMKHVQCSTKLSFCFFSFPSRFYTCFFAVLYLELWSTLEGFCKVQVFTENG